MDVTDLINKDEALREFEERVVLPSRRRRITGLGVGYRYERALDV